MSNGHDCLICEINRNHPEKEIERGREMGMKIYNGEFVSAETGEEEAFYGFSYDEVMRLLRKMKDGDSLVINCTE